MLSPSRVARRHLASRSVLSDDDTWKRELNMATVSVENAGRFLDQALRDRSFPEKARTEGAALAKELDEASAALSRLTDKVKDRPLWERLTGRPWG